MRAGLLRDYVAIERNAPTQGTSGEEIDNWTVLFNAWVHIRGTISNETEAIYTIRMRHLDITHNDRITFGARIFNITSVLDRDGMGRELVLEARELV